jgi:tRNA/tmRNA/rRNA uracil-C5-methylase (TrmA/RlmC/RlmD family)
MWIVKTALNRPLAAWRLAALAYASSFEAPCGAGLPSIEFATSVGMSTLYFAAAMGDNGGGKVIGAELVPAKVVTAKRNLADAGLADYAEIREGDARKTLRDLGGSVDFVLIDGWPLSEGPHLRVRSSRSSLPSCAREATS